MKNNIILISRNVSPNVSPNVELPLEIAEIAIGLIIVLELLRHDRINFAQRCSRTNSIEMQSLMWR